MKMINDLVSIIIPTYGGGKELAYAINSVLHQSYKMIEIIVVDDNNPESIGRKRTHDIMQKYETYENIKYIKLDHNSGGAVARNIGVDNSEGEFIGFLDDDDMYLTEKIKACVESIKGNPMAEAVFCNVIHVLDYKKCNMYVMTKENVSVKGILLNEAAIGTGSNLFISREAFYSLRGFNTDFIRHQDLEFAIRLCDKFQVEIVNEYLVVKASNGIKNEPNYYKMLQVKTLFNQTFSKEIDSLSMEDQKKYFLSCYNRLYLLALYAQDCSEAEKQLDLMKKYGYDLRIKNLLQLMMAKSGLYRLMWNLRYLRNKDNMQNKDTIEYEALDENIKESIKMIHEC